jgi:aminoglycoside phosphotransferase (APT) family kinase protein
MRKADVDLGILTALVGRIMAPRTRISLQRTEEGVSTQVYRICRAGEVFYLRVAEEPSASLAPEVRVHDLLQQRGVRVPHVVYFEPFNEQLQRSIMVVTAIAGEAVGQRPPDAATQAILEAAGQDLAVINDIPVQGFGWIKRDTSTGDRLEAAYATYRQYALEHFAADLALLSQHRVAAREIAALRGSIDRYEMWLQHEQAWLAHGDLDVTHIYQRDGRYTGIIDFGEIRGTDQFYDLGHFNLHDGERLPQLLLPALLAGYTAITPLPPDYEQRVAFGSMLIGVRALARALQRQPPSAYHRYLIAALRRALALLV